MRALRASGTVPFLIQLLSEPAEAKLVKASTGAKLDGRGADDKSTWHGVVQGKIGCAKNVSVRLRMFRDPIQSGVGTEHRQTTRVRNQYQLHSQPAVGSTSLKDEAIDEDESRLRVKDIRPLVKRSTVAIERSIYAAGSHRDRVSAARQAKTQDE